MRSISCKTSDRISPAEDNAISFAVSIRHTPPEADFLCHQAASRIHVPRVAQAAGCRDASISASCPSNIKRPRSVRQQLQRRTPIPARLEGDPSKALRDNRIESSDLVPWPPRSGGAGAVIPCLPTRTSGVASAGTLAAYIVHPLALGTCTVSTPASPPSNPVVRIRILGEGTAHSSLICYPDANVELSLGMEPRLCRYSPAGELGFEIARWGNGCVIESRITPKHVSLDGSAGP